MTAIDSHLRATAHGPTPNCAARLPRGLAVAVRHMTLGFILVVATICPRAGAADPPPPVTEQPANDAGAAKALPDAKVSFTSLSVDFNNPFAHEQAQHLQLSADGECVYRIDARAEERNHPALPGGRQKFRVAPERMRVLQTLLVKTNWLQAPGGEGPASHTHPDDLTITVDRGDNSNSVTCHGERPEPYLSLKGWIRGVLEQERRLYRMTSLDVAERREACRALDNELGALLGVHGRMYPIFEIDYSRYLPTLIESLHKPKEVKSEELVAAIDLVTYLRVYDEFDAVARLKHNEGVRSAVVRSLVRFGGQRGAKSLAEMGSERGEQIWGLICLREVGNEELVRLARSSPENVVRAHIDHWDELPGPPDPRIAASAGKALKEVIDHGGRREYFQEYLRLCVEEPPPAPGLSAQLNYLDVQLSEPLRFVHGWYVVSEDKIISERRLPAPAPGAEPFRLIFSAELDGAELNIHGGWRPARRTYGDRSNAEISDDGDVDLPPGTTLEVLYQWGKTRRDRRNNDSRHVRIPTHFRTLYDALVVKDGKTIMRILYVASVAAPGADSQSLWPPSAPIPRRTAPAMP